jgi:hypothetical protein
MYCNNQRKHRTNFRAEKMVIRSAHDITICLCYNLPMLRALYFRNIQKWRKYEIHENHLIIDNTSL